MIEPSWRCWKTVSGFVLVQAPDGHLYVRVEAVAAYVAQPTPQLTRDLLREVLAADAGTSDD